MNSTLRITTRGRIVFGALIALAIIALSLVLATPIASAGNSEVPNTYEYITVLAGDTLWDIAAEVDPGADPRDVVAEIMALNQLSSAALTPGQNLAIPR